MEKEILPELVKGIVEIMEVLSESTEEYDRGEKMEIFRKVGGSEYWIVDWRKNR